MTDQFQPQHQRPDTYAVEQLRQSHSLMMKLEIIKRLSMLFIIMFITFQLLGHIDRWVEIIWRK